MFVDLSKIYICMQMLQLLSLGRLLRVLSFARFNGPTAYANKSLKTIIFFSKTDFQTGGSCCGVVFTKNYRQCFLTLAFGCPNIKTFCSKKNYQLMHVIVCSSHNDSKKCYLAIKKKNIYSFHVI